MAKLISLAEHRARRGLPRSTARNLKATAPAAPAAAPAKRGRPRKPKPPEPDWLQPGLHAGAAVRLGLVLACHYAPGSLPRLEAQILRRFGATRKQGAPLSFWRASTWGGALLEPLSDAAVLEALAQRLGRRQPRDAQRQPLATIEELILTFGSCGTDLDAGLVALGAGR